VEWAGDDVPRLREEEKANHEEDAAHDSMGWSENVMDAKARA
jgi:hypothetical protein